MNCKNCNGILNEGAQFCTGCGQAIENIPATNETHPTFDNPGNGATEPPSKKKKILSSVLGFVIVAAIAIAWNVFFGGTDVVFETEGDTRNIRMAMPDGFSLSGDRTNISNGDCTISAGVVPTNESEAFLALFENEDTQDVRIRSRNWTKISEEGIRVLYTTLDGNVYSAMFIPGRNADCEREFDRIQRTLRLVR
jgi:hypothetical protein